MEITLGKLCVPLFKCNSLLIAHVNFVIKNIGNSLVVQWLGLSAFTAEGPGSIPGPGTKIPQAVPPRINK